MTKELTEALAAIQSQLAQLSERIAKLESGAAPTHEPAAPPDVAAAAPAAPTPPHETVSEEELLAISAALAAYFGVKVRIRQVRLISSRAWAQQGRVWVQASHRLSH